MSKVGFVILAHGNVFRLRQVILSLLNQDAPIAIHLDSKMPPHQRDALHYFFRNAKHLYWAQSQHCDWGSWSLVDAQIRTTKLILEKHPDLKYVYQISGSCMPLRPVAELEDFLLNEHDHADYIESVPLAEDDWVVDGLGRERVEHYHPFNWQTQRKLFDLNVKIQRAFKIKRKLPEGLKISFGSQWWCLSTKTLHRIFDDPDFESYTRFFAKSWIPDESFFQTLARKHSTNIQSRSLTYATFDSEGRPFLIYDDHLPILQRLDSFFIRKIWRGAEELYRYFLNPNREILARDVYAKLELEALLNYAKDIRKNGRVGLVSQFSLPVTENIVQTRAPYFVYIGFDAIKRQIYEYFYQSPTRLQLGYLFHPNRTEFEISKHFNPKNAQDLYRFRDYDKSQFLIQRIWYGYPKNIAFLAKPHHLTRLEFHFSLDKNANLILIRGAWILELLKRDIQNIDRLRDVCRIEMRREETFISKLKPSRLAELHCFELADLIYEPQKVSQAFPDQFEFDAPQIDKAALSRFVSKLVNNGVNLQNYQIELLLNPPSAVAGADGEQVISFENYVKVKNN